MNRIVASLFVCLIICFSSTFAMAEGPIQKSVADLYKDKVALKGQQVQLHGKIVKVNNGIMRRNFLHLQDGTGTQGTSDLTVTSKETANVGDNVIVVGTVALDIDFGGGYKYPLLLEKATITKAK